MKRKVMPPTIFWVFILLEVCVHFVLPVAKVITAPYRYLGVVLIIFGAVLNLWADVLFKRSGTTFKPHELPSELALSGPFKISWNPMYLGMAAILLGIAIVLGSLMAFVFPLVYAVIADLLFIRLEEQKLEVEFGDEYLRYKQKVRRWI